MKVNNAGSDVCERHVPPRSWGNFDKSAPLLTSTSVRLSIQFRHGDTPSAELAVWACIVPGGTMQHPVLLKRDSWMRFAKRTYTILPRQPSQLIFGERSLSVPRTEGLSTLISDNRPTTDTSHLEFTGVHAISLSSTPSLVPVKLVRSLGVPALTGHYMVSMLSRDGVSSETEIFVTKQSRSRDPLTSTQATFLGPLLLPSCKFRHRPYRTLPRNHYPLHPSLRFHCNRTVHPGHWLGWAHPTCLHSCFDPIPPFLCTNNDFGDYRRHGPRMDTSNSARITRPFVAALTAPNPTAGPLHSLPLGPRFIQAPAAGSPHRLPLDPHFAQGLTTDSPRRVFVCLRYDQDPSMVSPHGVPAGHHFVQDQDPAAASPHGGPAGHRFVEDQDSSASSPHLVPTDPRFVQGLAIKSSCSVSVGQISTFDHIAKSPSSSEKATVFTGAPPGLACRPPVVSPSSTSGVSVSTSPPASSGLIYFRTRHCSAAAAGTPRTPADNRFCRRPPATATSRPPSPQRHPPTLGSKKAAQRPATTQRRAALRTSSPSTVTSPSTSQPTPPSSSQATDPRPPPPPLPPALQVPPRLPEPNPSSSLLITSISVSASSTTLTLTGRASNAPSPSAPPPSGSFPWVHLRHHRTTSWATSSRHVTYLLRRS